MKKKSDGMIGGHFYEVKKENNFNLGNRKKCVTAFSSDFTLKIPELYWYTPYFCLLSSANKRGKCFSGFCMTENGLIVVCILETMCYNPDYDVCVYLQDMDKCVIERCGKLHYAQTPR
jgi:hypothetical protein